MFQDKLWSGVSPSDRSRTVMKFSEDSQFPWSCSGEVSFSLKERVWDPEWNAIWIGSVFFISVQITSHKFLFSQRLVCKSVWLWHVMRKCTLWQILRIQYFFCGVEFNMKRRYNGLFKQIICSKRIVFTLACHYCNYERIFRINKNPTKVS